jgi:hypothetical protein
MVFRRKRHRTKTFESDEECVLQLLPEKLQCLQGGEIRLLGTVSRVEGLIREECRDLLPERLRLCA